MSELSLKDRVAIVTGGASGIGRAIAIRLAQEGAEVVVADVVTDMDGELVKNACGTDSGASHRYIRTDVTSGESVTEMVGAVARDYGHIDILVNNAGINIPRLLVDPKGVEEITEGQYEKMTAVNIKGVVLCAQAVARHMIQRGAGGVIINMSSEAGTEGSEGQSIYAATKAALYTLTRSWAKELGRHNIRVVGLAPGILEATGLRSPEYERALAYTRGITVDDLRAGYEKVATPLRRVGQLSEVADAACFVASDMASYITGTVIMIAGGKSRG
jgi:sorbitol-6-phosphate 2-dehydrogenase